MKKLLFLILFPVFGICQIPDPKPNTFVNDLAGVLDARQVNVLNDSIRALETKTGVELDIVLIKDLPADIEIEDYALQIGRKWHVGYTNGLVYVAALNSHKQRLEVADKMQ